MATREAGIAVAVVGAVGVVAAACITSGAYHDMCPASMCGRGAPATQNAPAQQAQQAQQAPDTKQEKAGATTSPAAKPRATDECADGYVWREAYTGDHVCVTPATRDQARRDNAAAADRRSPTGGPYGPDTCVQGYVWRGANDADHVCVTPATRDQTSRDNQLAESRRAH